MNIKKHLYLKIQDMKLGINNYNTFNKNKKPKFYLLLIIGVIVLTLAFYSKILLFKLFVGPYIFYCCFFLMKEKKIISETFYNAVFSYKNIAIRFFVIIISFLFFSCSILLLFLLKFLAILLIGLFFKDKFTIMNISKLFVMCLISSIFPFLFVNILLEPIVLSMQP